MQVPGSSLSSFRAHSVADLPRLPLAEDVEFTGKTEALVLELLQPPAFLASRTGAGLPSSPPGSAPVLFGTFHAFPSVFPPEGNELGYLPSREAWLQVVVQQLPACGHT